MPFTFYVTQFKILNRQAEIKEGKRKGEEQKAKNVARSIE
jgi:hypothetical protein